MKMLRGALQWSVYPQWTGSIYTKWSMYAGTHFTDSGRMESWVNFNGKEGRANIQPLTMPGIELGFSGLGGRDLYHCANPSVFYFTEVRRRRDGQAFVSLMLNAEDVPNSCCTQDISQEINRHFVTSEANLVFIAKVFFQTLKPFCCKPLNLLLF